ncbi:MAG: hypothetical protein JOZ46_01095 [Candidatus Dormibacteraeota bacterium]|nr:hypothetical protein [Candidatus Dormibacteraeota bacterium]MBV9524389.1 hypothetical protein [Candidatus Dormibacteraeota bacterium]
MSEASPLSQLPYQVTHQEFLRTAGSVAEGGACCVFVIDDAIPAAARAGYAGLVIAFARADEPVYIPDDGSATLLIRAGGVDAGRIAAGRVIGQLRRFALHQTLRAAVAPLDADADAAVARARAAAESAPPGDVVLG